MAEPEELFTLYTGTKSEIILKYSKLGSATSAQRRFRNPYPTFQTAGSHQSGHSQSHSKVQRHRNTEKAKLLVAKLKQWPRKTLRRFVKWLKTTTVFPLTILLVKLELMKFFFAHSPEEAKAPPLQAAWFPGSQWLEERRKSGVLHWSSLLYWRIIPDFGLCKELLWLSHNLKN